LNLSGNCLCGVREDVNGRQHGEYASEGIKAIADALRVNGGLTSIDVRQNSIAGDGAVQLAVAVLGNLNINFFNEIPIKEMRANSLTELDLKGKDVGVEGGMVVAGLIPVMGALTSLELRGNQLRDKGWGAIFAAICGNKDSKILFLDVSSEDIGPAGVKLIAEALRTSVTGGPTSLNLSDNQLCGLDRHGRGTYSAEGITAIADALRANGALTSVDLRGNQLRDEGWGAIFAAICGNKDSKIMSMDAHYENIGLVGGKLIAEALRTTVTGSLTSLELRRNQLGDKGWGAIFAAICGNKDSKIMSLDAAAESIGPAGVKLIAEALRTSVTGGLTKLSLAHNNVGEVGTKAICKALEQNTTLKELDISGDWRGSNTGGSAGAKHVAKMLCVNGGLTALNLSSNSLKDEGVNAVCEAIQSNKETKLASLNFSYNSIGPVGANAVAAMVAVTGALTKLSLAKNELGEEGIKAICEALEQNKSLKELDISGDKFGYKCSTIGGSAGAKRVAKMLGVNGSLTQVLAFCPRRDAFLLL
jgi:hypothetical protein